jgi:hypothetical protein
MQRDPGQIENLFDDDNLSIRSEYTLFSRAFGQVTPRLDALLMVLKSCKGVTCTDPWGALHPQGDVKNLKVGTFPSIALVFAPLTSRTGRPRYHFRFLLRRSAEDQLLGLRTRLPAGERGAPRSQCVRRGSARIDEAKWFVPIRRAMERLDLSVCTIISRGMRRWMSPVKVDVTV